MRGEEAYRGERFAEHPRDVAGDPDLLNITRPEIVREIHDAYFEAGADIATTNTFTATSIGQADYGLEDVVREMNVEGARLARARRCVDGATPDRPRFVAGSVGPLNVTLSLSPQRRRPRLPRASRSTQVREAYAEQMRALREGGVDLLLIETIFDTLNAKAAIVAAQEVAPELPLWLSFTAIDRSGRNLSGQTVEAFWASVEHAEPLIVGVNCSLGATRDAAVRRGPRARRDDLLACHPNAGLPNAFGAHDEQPRGHEPLPRASSPRTASSTSSAAAAARRPSTSRAIARRRRGRCRRGASPSRRARPRFSGLEPFEIGPDTGFVMIGERTNVTGSARFRRLIEARRLPGRRRGRARAGARRRQPARREHGRRPARLASRR